jgi:hypothetical protein
MKRLPVAESRYVRSTPECLVWLEDQSRSGRQSRDFLGAKGIAVLKVDRALGVVGPVGLGDFELVDIG